MKVFTFLIAEKTNPIKPNFVLVFRLLSRFVADFFLSVGEFGRGQLRLLYWPLDSKRLKCAGFCNLFLIAGKQDESVEVKNWYREGFRILLDLLVMFVKFP